MLPIVDKPTIQYIVEEAVAAGIRDILIVTGKSKKILEDYFDSAPELESLLEREGKEEFLQICRSTEKLANIHIYVSLTLQGLPTQYCLRRRLRAETRSRFCWATI